VRILYAAPISKRYNAMATETRLAAEHGHEICLVAQHRNHWETHPLDPRVEVHWLGAGPKARRSRLVTLALCRGPRAVLRRLGGPGERAMQTWNRRVADPIERRRQDRTNALRQAYRRQAVLDLVDAADWLVLGEPGAIDLLADELPGLLARRPELRTTYSYEDFAEDPGA
jgi:hypothetical protein